MLAKSSGSDLNLKVACVSTATFFWFQLYQLEFFLHFSQRFTFIGIMRPTVIMFLIITALLFFQKDIIKIRLRHPIFIAFSALIIYLILSLPLVTYPGSVIKKNVMVFLKAIVFLYYTALILDTDKRIKWAVFVFVACQVIRVLEPLFLNITTGYWGSSTYMGDGEFASRLSGAPSDLINPNELGFVIATVLPFLHFFLLKGRWNLKVLYFILLPLMLYALILTMSRGAFLALLVVGWIIFKESRRKVVLIVLGIFIVIGGLSVMNDIQRDRYLSIFSSDAAQSKSRDGRINGIFREFELGLQRPIFGHGLGTTPEAKFHIYGKTQASHTMYGELLIEIGFIGMILFLRMIINLRRQITFSLRAENDEFYGTLFKVINIVFWMFVVYSINYWGLSQYYWYNLAGLTIAAAMLSKTTLVNGKK